ncbi:MAG TPA: DNA polymerase III subunit gamma/tau [Polyangiaceae bacterium]|jgi:DNA polymerase-3 subunit gamma/tau
MSYLVLARKWRPMRFDDLVGQEHVARTLDNAIETNRVAHAFLFTGVRGVGKTTSARILAKALCCLGDPDLPKPAQDPGPTIKPCLKCAACLEIALGTDMDVREIDGASYNGVDEVRKLQDSLPYRPTRDRYKIFIVDEVHMLSQSAWNAFLKTLEEPPPHVKFIFATTEVHKVPVTILSRVQRFDFKLIAAQTIAARLRYVLEQEKVEADEAALSIIAREAAGSMRDAMSLLDQVIAWGGSKLVGDEVARVLGVASRSVLHELAGALVRGDASRCLALVSDVANQGYDMAHVARDVLGLLRDLVVAKVCEAPESLLDLPAEEIKDVRTLADATGKDDVIRLHQGFSQGFDEVVRGGQPRASLEMLLVRLARRPALIPVDELLRRLAALEQRLGGGGGPRGSAPDRGPSEPTPTRRSAPREPAQSAPAQSASSPAPALPSTPASPSPRSPASSASASASVPHSPTPTSPPSAPAPHSRPLASAGRGNRSDAEVFRAILERVSEKRPELGAFLAHAAVLAMEPGEIVVGWEPGSVFGKDASGPAETELLASAASAELGAPTRIRHELDSPRVQKVKTLAAIDTEARDQKTREALTQARKHHRVTDAVEVLGARVRELKLPQA